MATFGLKTGRAASALHTTYKFFDRLVLPQLKYVRSCLALSPQGLAGEAEA